MVATMTERTVGATAMVEAIKLQLRDGKAAVQFIIQTALLRVPQGLHLSAKDKEDTGRTLIATATGLVASEGL